METSIIENIKLQFPILSGDDLVYLDSAATTQKPRMVTEAIQYYYERQNSNIHRSVYKLAADATEAYESARKNIADYLNASSSSEIVFTRGTTESVNLVAQSFALPRLQEGDNMVISAMEHHSNLVPWQMICQKAKATLRVIPMNDQGELEIDSLDELLDERTRMLAVVHISNSLGTINPVKEIIQKAREKGIPTLVDGAQSISHLKIDVEDLDCDFFAFSGHKAFGPTGIGVLYAKAKHLEEMEPYQYGGEMIRTVSLEHSTWNRIPHKFEAGTPHIAGAIGLSKAIDFIRETDPENIHRHTQTLLDYIMPKLLEIPGFRLYGKALNKTGIISFLIGDIHPHDLGTFLNEKNIAIRAGHHCTQPVMQYFGIPGTARASLSCYNTESDMDRLYEALSQAQKFFN